MRITPKEKDVSRKNYRIDWNGKSAKVRMILRLNLIEAQRQILERGRQNKAVTGLIIGLLISLILWAIIAAVAL